MGRKISVDSATLMNKGLELIEACLLFGLAPEQVEIVIHRQSIVHSLVEYVDGSVLAQLGSPDMRTPIAHALAWPKRLASGVDFLDLIRTARLDFCAPDSQRFRCLALAQAVARSGGLEPAILNAANEVAVQAFLERRLNFTEIPGVIEAVLKGMNTGGLSQPRRRAGRRRRGEEPGTRARPCSGAGARSPCVNVAWQILWFIVAVGLLVTVHEFGHYWVARRLGFKVLRFSIGFGKPLWKKVAGADRTEYVVAALPLGGYVKMLDEREGPGGPGRAASLIHPQAAMAAHRRAAGRPCFQYRVRNRRPVDHVLGERNHRAARRGRARSRAARRRRLPASSQDDEIVSLNGSTVTGHSDVVFGLLDAMSTDGSATLVLERRRGRHAQRTNRD